MKNLSLVLTVTDETDDDNPHVRLHRVDLHGPPSLVAATLRAVADDLDPKRPTMRGGPFDLPGSRPV